MKESKGKKTISWQEINYWVFHCLRYAPIFCASFPFFSFSMWRKSLWIIYKQNKEHKNISLLNAFRNWTDLEWETWFVHHHTWHFFALYIPLSTSPSDCHFCFCFLKLPLSRMEAVCLAFNITYLQQLWNITSFIEKNKMENLRSWWKGKVKAHHHMPTSKYPDVIPFLKPSFFYPMSSPFCQFQPWLSVLASLWRMLHHPINYITEYTVPEATSASSTCT